MAREGVLFELRFDTDLPPVLGDKEQLLQVLHNIVENALNALSESSETLPRVRRWIRLEALEKARRGDRISALDTVGCHG